MRAAEKEAILQCSETANETRTLPLGPKVESRTAKLEGLALKGMEILSSINAFPVLCAWVDPLLTPVRYPLHPGAYPMCNSAFKGVATIWLAMAIGLKICPGRFSTVPDNPDLIFS